MKGLLSTLLGLALCLQLHAQQIIHVSPNGMGDGSSWTQSISNLNQALNLAQAGDQVWVAEGTYLPTTTNEREAAFVIKDGIQLYGGFAGFETKLVDRKWQHHPTILSGEIGEPGEHDNVYNVVYTKDVSSNTVLDGFIIAHGSANGEVVEGNRLRCGGGWYNDGSNNGHSSPMVINCTFFRNTARDGAAFYSNGNAGFSRPTFVNCVFKNNRADLDGGAIYNDSRNHGNSLPVLEECLFEDNLASYGAGIFAQLGNGTCNLDLRNCTFKKNTAFLWGGGIFTMGQPTKSAINMTDCKFAENYPTDINKTYSLTKKD